MWLQILNMSFLEGKSTEKLKTSFYGNETEDEMKKCKASASTSEFLCSLFFDQNVDFRASYMYLFSSREKLDLRRTIFGRESKFYKFEKKNFLLSPLAYLKSIPNVCLRIDYSNYTIH